MADDDFTTGGFAFPPFYQPPKPRPTIDLDERYFK